MKKKELLSKLRYWLQSKESLFKGAASANNVLGQEKTRRIFVDRDSDILLMAHIDTVCVPKLKKHKGNKIWAAGLDDRLGCLIASTLSEELNTDLLITDFEENAASSGQYHELKNYNWIAEFDRNGGDVVTYDLDCDEFLMALKECFTIGIGSFSDLCFLETESCCVNIGIGYKHDHSEDSYVDLAVLNSQLSKFYKFFHKNKNTQFVQDGKISYSHFPHNYTNQDYWDQYFNECDFCGNLGAKEVYGVRICESCFDCMSNDYLYADWESRRN